MGAGDKGGGKSQPNPAGSNISTDADKAKRRAEALRANLKRRKTQQRDRAEIGKAPNDGD